MRYLIPSIFTLLILLSGQAFSTYEKAELERVIDGDTIETESDTIRFLGVDTPELSTDNRPQEYGLENSSENRECLNRYAEEASEFVQNSTGENITLLYDHRSDERGTYGRRLAYVHEDGDLNRKLLVEGLAKVYPSSFSRWNEFYFWQYVAKKNSRGLWSCSG
jgi:micrococcal nuclease